MDMRKRILIVEDDPILRKQYQGIVESSQVAVDVATNRDEALRHINFKTYHVALVDIMLNGPDDLNDRGGVDVIKRLNELDEGTKIIVLSGAKDIEVPVEVLVECRVYTYIIKPIRSRNTVLSPLQECLRTASIKTYGRFRSLIDYLAIGLGEMLWVDRAIRILKPLDGYAGLSVFVNQFYGAMSPLLPKRGANHLMEIDENAGLIRGATWSKAVGTEVILFARHGLGEEGVPPPAPDRTATLIWDYNKVLVHCWAYSVEATNRDDFINSILDVPYPKEPRQVMPEL